MADSRPNVLLLMTDQQRGDCLGIEGHPVLQTPHLDWIGASGFHFRKAYTACPVCVPARRTLMTGQRPATQGTFMNYHTVLRGPTLPGELGKAGYQTHLCGKTHLWPERTHYGFDSMDWADSGMCRGHYGSDYQRFLLRHGLALSRMSDAHGVCANDWVPRPWHLEERFHFTNWCADCAIDFLERRDRTRPFFLKVSVIHPHQPWVPPQVYYDRYLNMDLPEPVVGDWARVFDGPQRGLYPDNTWRGCFDEQMMHQMRAAYYGCINHISDQFGRILHAVPRNTIVVFTSDHGEMIGDHQWLRKRNAFEPSARIPFMIRFPEAMGLDQGRAFDIPVELMDIMPTLLEACGAAVPDSVEGSSLLPVLRGQTAEWREYLHGECAEVPSLNSGMQYVTDGRRKYVWFPGRAEELFFDLETDPHELFNLASEACRAGEVAMWRERLIGELTGRPEGFVKDGVLQRLDGPTPFCMPGFEQPPLQEVLAR